MFKTIFNKQHAITLREYGFSASEISEYLGCSKDWVYGVVKQSVDAEKRKELMDYVISLGDSDDKTN
jgi:orotate phosphoribosyltransferase-like protein